MKTSSQCDSNQINVVFVKEQTWTDETKQGVNSGETENLLDPSFGND